MDDEMMSQERAAELTALAVSTVNMAWMTRISNAMKKRQLPFETPRDLHRFAGGATLLVTAFSTGDKQAIVGVLTAIGCIDDDERDEALAGMTNGRAEDDGAFLDMVRTVANEGATMPDLARDIITDAVMRNPGMLG